MSSTLAVIIPVYNGERFIRNAITSITNQTLQPEEIIVVNDGSSDNTSSILHDLQIQHKHLIVIGQKNQGVSFARNKAISASSCDILAFLDTDDYWHPQKLSIQLKALHSHDLDMICTKVIHIKDNDSDMPDNDSTYDEDNINVKDYSLGEIIYKPHLTTSSIMVKRKIFDAVGGFDVTFRTAEDQVFYIDVANKYKVGCVDTPLVYKCNVEDSLSSGFDSYSDSLKVLERFVRKNPDVSSKNMSTIRKARARIYREYSADLLWNREVSRSLKPLLFSMKEHFTVESLKLFLILIKSSILNLFNIRNVRN